MKDGRQPLTPQSAADDHGCTGAGGVVAAGAAGYQRAPAACPRTGGDGAGRRHLGADLAGFNLRPGFGCTSPGGDIDTVAYRAVNVFGGHLKHELARGVSAMTLLSIGWAALASATLLSSTPTAWAVEQNPMFACMEKNRIIPPAARASVCTCYVEKAGSWSVRLGHLVSSQAIVDASTRSMLSQCIAAEYSARDDVRKPL